MFKKKKKKQIFQYILKPATQSPYQALKTIKRGNSFQSIYMKHKKRLLYIRASVSVRATQISWVSCFHTSSQNKPCPHLKTLEARDYMRENRKPPSSVLSWWWVSTPNQGGTFHSGQNSKLKNIAMLVIFFLWLFVSLTFLSLHNLFASFLECIAMSFIICADSCDDHHNQDTVAVPNLFGTGDQRI